MKYLLINSDTGGSRIVKQLQPLDIRAALEDGNPQIFK